MSSTPINGSTKESSFMLPKRKTVQHLINRNENNDSTMKISIFAFIIINNIIQVACESRLVIKLKLAH